MSVQDPQAFLLGGLMEANIHTMRDWRDFIDSLMSIASQTQKLGLLGISIYLSPELFPQPHDTLTRTIFEIETALVGEGSLRVLNRKEAKRPMQHFQELVRRVPAWFKGSRPVLDNTWITLVPHRGIWHPQRVEKMSAAIAMTRPGNGLDEYKISTVCFLESTVDAPGEPRLKVEDGLSAADVQLAVEGGMLRTLVGDRMVHRRWLSEAHDLCTPLWLTAEFFNCPPNSKRQFLINRNRFCDSDYAFWARTYQPDVYKSIFPNVTHWLVYWRREPDDNAIIHVAMAGKDDVVPVRAGNGLADGALEEHAQLIAEMWEIEHWQEPAKTTRMTQASMLGTEREPARMRYLKLCAEACIERHRELEAFIKTV